MNAAKLCSDLIQIRSDNPPGDTSEIAEYILSVMEGLGIPGTITSGPDGHDNVISKDQAGRLLLTGHIDVVPALNEGWKYPPYSGKIDDTCVHGRGATDMKGGCAAVLSAVARAKDAGDDLPVSLAFVCDEEGGGRYGTRYLLEKNLIHPCDVLIAEPTPAYAPAVGQKGVCRFDVEFVGTPGHSSLYPILGESAVIQAMDFLYWMGELHKRVYPQTEEMEKLIEHSTKIAGEGTTTDFGPVFRQIMYNPGIISGGERVNIVAQKCTLMMDMRLPWGCDCDEILDEICSHIPKSAVLTPRTKANASLTASDSFLVQKTCEAISEVYGITSRPMVQWAASDARALRLAGFRALEYGPGDLSTMHGLNEKVSIDQLNKCEEIYYRLIQNYTNTKQEIS
ncbi:peptidase M20 [Methanocorpusculum labreanum Z]|uniref:Peptidase M20 n=1 Tax=Methanocorpusculum labreanum (strain ATCC 43576 / DSM 4855 / Z) TaxID=410358 RepID=A2SSX8_METLZ|nr:M20 family metallopeptidase [Methanocorpusculum labreanum]ABN07434.1 peptidase M20 [Methanocorpusculum labreanum Z]